MLSTIQHSAEDGSKTWVIDTIPSSPAFLMREEGVKLYLYNPTKSSDYHGYQDEVWPYEEDECLVYDFSLGVGESYKTVDSFMGECMVTVDSIYSWKDLDGVDRKCQRITYKVKGKDEFIDWFKRDYIEGFGPVQGWGWFGLIQSDAITGTPYYSPPYPNGGDQSSLDVITDLKGNILFRTNDGWNTSPDKLMPEDYVWYYYECSGGLSRVRDYNEFQMQFVGRETVNNREYRLFKTVKSTMISYDVVDKTYTVTEEDTDKMQPFYMYSVGDRVYVNRGLGIMRDPDYPESEESLALVYDFGTWVGDTIRPMTSMGGWYEDGIVSKVGSVDLPTGSVPAYNLDLPELFSYYADQTPYNTIMGIGNLFGCFPFYDTAHLAGAPEVNPKAPYRPMNIELIKVTDKKGNLIFESEFGKNYTGLQELTADPSEPDAVIYDIMGLPVANPQPGSIYIRNGKKFVMK